MSNQGNKFWGVSFLTDFNKFNSRVSYNSNCLRNKQKMPLRFFQIFCSWNVAAFFFLQYSKQIAAPFFFFFLRYQHFTRVCALPVWREYVWHLGMAQCEQTGHHWVIGTGLSAVCLMPCLLWKSPWNRRSKYPHWSGGRGPYDDVVAKSHRSKSNRQ